MKRILHNSLPLFALCLALSLAAFGCSSGGNGTPDAGSDADAGGGDEGPQSCTSTTECPIHNLCIGGLCQPGEVCSSGAPDCPNGYECNFLKEVCVPETLCVDDQDCSAAAMSYCLLPDGFCVECTQDVHCGADHFCNDAYQCEAEGPDCTSDTDCTEEGKPYCGNDGKCYACVTDSHCQTQQQVCELSRHVCVDCYQHGHCTSAGEPFCFVEGNVCVECLSDMHCAVDWHCNLSIHECTDVICETDADCATGLKCKQDTGDCVQCLEHSQCGSNQWCRDYSCLTGCFNDTECQIKEGEKHYCDDATQRCYYAECMNDLECADNPDGLWCYLDEQLLSLKNNCVECLQDSHCDEYYECNPANKTCRPVPCFSLPEGQQCPDLDDCYFCDYDGECKPRGTSTSYHPDNTCYDEQNNPDNNLCCRGYTCNTAGRCALVDHCTVDEDCPIGWSCADYQQCTMEPCCDPACGAGEFCNGDCVCESGCHDAGEGCDPFSQNCCEGLYCAFFPPICKSSS